MIGVLLAAGLSQRSSQSAEQFPDPLVSDPEHWRLEFENERVRVTRAKVGPHEVERMHQHSLPAVVVYLTDLDIQQTLPDGADDTQGSHQCRGPLGECLPFIRSKISLTSRLN